MNGTIVVLLMIFVLLTIMSIPKMGKLLTKKNEIEFYSKKLKEAQDEKDLVGVRATAYITVLAIRVVIIYYSVSVILSLVKG